MTNFKFSASEFSDSEFRAFEISAFEISASEFMGINGEKLRSKMAKDCSHKWKRILINFFLNTCRNITLYTPELSARLVQSKAVE